MNHYVAKSRQITGILTLDFNSQIVHVISLQSARAFFYYQNGVYVVWNIQNNSKINEGMICPNVKVICALNTAIIAFINPEEKQLMLLDLFTNKLDPNFTMDLPSQMSLPKGEKRDSPKMVNIVNHGSKLLALPTSNLLILCQEQKSVHPGMSFDYVITVINREIFPNFHSQFIYSSPVHRCHIRTINKKDTVILWPEMCVEGQLSFLHWNVINKEKGCQSLMMKESLVTSIVSATSWGVNKVAFWMNPTFANRPELRIMNTQDSNEFKGAIDCYEQEDWVISQVMFLDPEKNFAVIKRMGNVKCSVDIIALNKFKKTWQKTMTNNNLFSFSLDGKFFIQYPNLNLHINESEKENPEETGDEMVNQEQNENNVTFHYFEAQIANPQIRVLYAMEKAKILNKFGNDVARRVISMLFPIGKQL